MPPPDISMVDRGRAVDHMQDRLQRIGQPQEKARAMAARVEEAVYNKANSKHDYLAFLKNSLAKAEAALHQALAGKNPAQAAAATGQATQHAVMQPAALQQQQTYGMSQQGTTHNMAQQAGGQYTGMAQTQSQPQQQYVQQQQAGQQYISMAQAQPQQQQYMQAQPVQQQQHMMGQQQQAMQYVQAPMQDQAAQTQYMRQPQQQYVQQQTQYVQQQPQPQQQYVQQPAAVQSHYAQAPPQQQYIQQPVQQQQQHYAQQPSQQQYGQLQMHQGYIQQPAQPQQQQQYMAQPAQQPQQQYVAQGRGGGYTVQQYGTSTAHAVQPQAMHQQPIQQAILQPPVVTLPGPSPQQQLTAPAIQPKQLGPGEMDRFPSFDDPIFSDFVADLFPLEPQSAAAAAAPVAQQPTPPRFAAHPQTSTAESKGSHGPAVGSHAAAAVAGSVAHQQRDHSSGAVAGGTQKQHTHDPHLLQEYSAIHAYFNRPEHRAKMKQDGEHMLQAYLTQPGQAEAVAKRMQRDRAVLGLLLCDNPHQRVSINASVLELTKVFLRRLTAYQDLLKKKAAAKLAAAAGAATPAAGVPPITTGGAPSPGGFMAMLESAGSGVLKLESPAGSAAASAGAPTAQHAQHAQHAQQPGAAAEAARQQALLRQRQLKQQQQQQLQQQRGHGAAATAAAAATATAPLPADAVLRLLAVAKQTHAPQQAAAIKAGFRRLQKVLHAADQKQLASAVQPVSTPPLPAEAQRLVARERAMFEAAAEEAGASSKGATALITTATGHGFVQMQQPEAATEAGAEGGATDEQLAAKRQRSSSPGVPVAGADSSAGQPSTVQAAGQAFRVKSELEKQLVAECEEASSAMGGAMYLAVAPDSSDPAAVLVTCLPKAARITGSDCTGNSGNGSRSNNGRVSEEQRWQVLMLRVSPGYPELPPTAVFPRTGYAAASAAAAAAAERQQLLLDACRERFVAGVAAVAEEQQQHLGVRHLAQAWLEATQHVAARLCSRQEEQVE